MEKTEVQNKVFDRQITLTDKEIHARLTYATLNGYCIGRGLIQTQQAMGIAINLHSGQRRKDGLPYIAHPLSMVCDYLMPLDWEGTGIDQDTLFSIAMLHDVCEDCDVSTSSLDTTDDIRRGVSFMTINYHGRTSSDVPKEEKREIKKEYFMKLLDCPEALIVKAVDRIYNLSTMIGVFTEEEIAKNVKETAEMLLPVLKEAKLKYPRLANNIQSLRTQLKTINTIIAKDHNVELPNDVPTIMGEKLILASLSHSSEAKTSN